MRSSSTMIHLPSRSTTGSGGATNTGDASDASDASDPSDATDSSDTADATDTAEPDNTADCPEAETFMDLSAYAGAAGAGYDDPQVSATCTETTMTVTSNGIPNYTFVQITPNALTSQNYNYITSAKFDKLCLKTIVLQIL